MNEECGMFLNAASGLDDNGSLRFDPPRMGSGPLNSALRRRGRDNAWLSTPHAATALGVAGISKTLFFLSEADLQPVGVCLTSSKLASR